MHKMQLGFVGTGTMGAPMAGCLIDAGHQLAVYDVGRDATAALCARGARLAGSPWAVALQSEVVFSSMAGNIFYVGSAGAGCAAKLVTQYLGYTNFIAALEGMLIGAKAGIDLGVLARIVPLSAGASRTFDNIPRSVLSGAFTAGGTLDIVAKDLQLACDLAREVAAPAYLGLIAHDVLSRAQAQGWGQQGFPIAARILEAAAGVELRASVADVTGYRAEDPRRGAR